MEYSAQLTILGHVLLSMVLGGVVGAEREQADKPAGFRTHMFIAAASTLLVGLGTVILGRYEGGGDMAVVRADPLRIIEAIITGISFLGAGTIFRDRGSNHVEGLTTAASILLVAAVGMAVALAQYILAAGMTILALIMLRGLIWVQDWFNGKKGGE